MNGVVIPAPIKYNKICRFVKFAFAYNTVILAGRVTFQSD